MATDVTPNVTETTKDKLVTNIVNVDKAIARSGEPSSSLATPDTDAAVDSRTPNIKLASKVGADHLTTRNLKLIY